MLFRREIVMVDYRTVSASIGRLVAAASERLLSVCRFGTSRTLSQGRGLYLFEEKEPMRSILK